MSTRLDPWDEPEDPTTLLLTRLSMDTSIVTDVFVSGSTRMYVTLLNVGSQIDATFFVQIFLQVYEVSDPVRLCELHNSLEYIVRT